MLTILRQTLYQQIKTIQMKWKKTQMTKTDLNEMENLNRLITSWNNNWKSSHKEHPTPEVFTGEFYQIRQLKMYVHTEAFTEMIIAALLTIAKRCKQLKCPSVDPWINRTWSIHTMEHCSAIKINEVLIHVTMWMNFEIVMLSEISQTQIATC